MTWSHRHTIYVSNRQGIMAASKQPRRVRQIAAYCQIVVSSNSNLGEAVVLIWNDCNMPFWSCLLLNDTLGAAFRLIPWLHAWCLDDRLFLQCRYRRRNKSGPGQRGMLTHDIRGLRMSRLPSKLR